MDWTISLNAPVIEVRVGSELVGITSEGAVAGGATRMVGALVVGDDGEG